MSGFRLFVPIMLSFALVLGGVQAQEPEEDAPFRHLLALVPNVASVWESSIAVSYADYRLAERARGLATTFPDFESYQAVSRDLVGRTWLNAIRRIYGGYTDLLQNFFVMDDLKQVIGIDFFEIDRTLIYGEIPSQGAILAGDFDLEAIRAAYSARGYARQANDRVELWCSPFGCQNADQIDFSNRNTSDPFGGNLGRQQPVMVSEGALFSTMSFEKVLEAGAVRMGTVASLAQDPLYATVTDALLAQGQIIQVMFVNVFAISGFDPATMLRDPSQAEALLEQLAAYPALPPYMLVAFADILTERNDEEVTLIALVYGDAETAEAAGQALVDRLAIAQSPSRDQLVSELLAEREITVGEPMVVGDSENGVVVLLLPWRNPLPDPETASGRAYDLLINMFYRRDVAWLSFDFAPQD